MIIKNHVEPNIWIKWIVSSPYLSYLTGFDDRMYFGWHNDHLKNSSLRWLTLYNTFPKTTLWKRKSRLKKWWQWLDKINCVLFCLYSIIESLQFVPKHSAPKWKNNAFIFTCKLVCLYLEKNSWPDSKIFEHYAPLQKKIDAGFHFTKEYNGI